MSDKKHICKNCKLYNKKESVCTVTIVHEGEYYELPVKPNDPCIWEKEGIAVETMKAWSDGENGFIEYTV